ncbi:hypothetical protein LguiA_013117 [Lonicera macranthoides]
MNEIEVGDEVFCTDPKLDKANDFFFSNLCNTGNTSNPVGSVVTPTNVVQIPGLNILGISLVRIDHAPNSLNPPHIHSRAVEALIVLEDTLYVGFVTSNTGNRLFTKVLVTPRIPHPEVAGTLQYPPTGQI